MRRLSMARARRIALAAQGFNDRPPSGKVTARHFRRVLDRMTILQLDSVNVLCRSHFLPVFARLGPYDRDRLDHWLWRSGENHEYLSHEASLTSMELYPLLRPRMGERRWKAGVRLEREHPDYVAAVLDEIRERGPLSVSDLSDPGGRTGPWWGYSKGKLCLDHLYTSGRLSIRERTPTFLTIYDLPERVVPDRLRCGPTPSREEAHRHMLLLGARSHGVGTANDLADYFRIKISLARPLLADLVEQGELEVVQVEGWNEPAYLHPDAKQPRAIDRSTFLSPFDPVVWYRPRAERLFQFHYRIEIYVPEAKRIHGYYVLPFLHQEQLAGRVDVKADRKGGQLLARGSFAESGADVDEVAPAMARSLHSMASWLGLDGVTVEPIGDLAAPLRAAIG